MSLGPIDNPPPIGEEDTFEVIQEDISFWPVDGTNEESSNAFDGVGYTRVVWKIKRGPNGNIPRD